MINDNSTALRRRGAWHAAALAVRDRTPASPLACRQGFVLTHDQAHDAGVPDRDVRSLVRRRQWTVPRRGALCVLPPARDGRDEQPHGSRSEIAAAAVALVRREAVISHECAGLAQGLDVLGRPRLATLTTCGRRYSGARGGAVIRAAWLDEDELNRWFGVPITCCARTVVDLARQGIAHGLVAADSALYSGLVTVDDLEVALARAARWHGVIGARRLLDLASPLSESPLESVGRLFLADRRLPLPRQQAWVDTDRGRYRVDGLWDSERVVLELDGLVKYRGEHSGEEDPLVLEKLRQEALERAGYRVVRVLWRDVLRDPDATEARIRHLLRPCARAA